MAFFYRKEAKPQREISEKLLFVYYFIPLLLSAACHPAGKLPTSVFLFLPQRR